LDFGRLQVAKAREIDGTDYPISHEWGHTPIHLVGAGVELERRTAGVAGAARMSPHALVQDYLNRVPTLWGIVSNGRELRLLRDNVSLTRQAYLAFDLEAMLSGEVYSDFALLWLIFHESRFESPEDKPTECWLERWTQAAQAQGTRALNTLRDGVETALSTLGAGFVSNPANATLREALVSGELATADLYRELLRLVYRLIFLFVAEDRDLLHPEGTSESARSHYRDFYSMARLRRIAERLRGGPHPDLWRGIVVVCSKLADDDGAPDLGLPFLGSALFSTDACPHLDAASLSNRDLLDAVRALGFTEQGRVLRQIDYRNLGSEELGSIYESLLELHPEVHHESGTFTLATAAGNERKTTGSYYTPTSLISALLDTALDPVLDEAAAKPDPEVAILDLKVLDPACGSGHFLVAAAHRIAKRLAGHRMDEPEPSPAAYREALRDVIGHCIFGIDVNPMAVELCKVSLWMEAVEPGKPLSFLEHHIVCGNSLFGTTPALLANGIPDEAFTALEGDDKATVKSLKARNKQERKGQASLFGEAARPDLISPIAGKVAALEAVSDDSPEALHAKEQAWTALEKSEELVHARLVADAWCAAFVIEKTPDAPVLTHGVLELLERHPAGGDPKLHEAIEELGSSYRFLHPHLAFPQVFHTPSRGEVPDDPDQGWTGGFDLVVGNPPWERVKLQEKEWFSQRSSAVATAKNSAQRKALIRELQADDPDLYRNWLRALRHSEGESKLLRGTKRFPLCGRGDINTYAVFAELMRCLLANAGQLGALVPIGVATDDTTKLFFADLVQSQHLRCLLGFENEEFLFPAVHHSTKFCLLFVSGRASTNENAEFVFFARSVSDLTDQPRRFRMTPDDFQLLNPNTLTCPVFHGRRDAELTKSVHRRVPILVLEDEGGDNSPWGLQMREMIHMANDSGSFLPEPEPLVNEAAGGPGTMGKVGLRLYEAKMFHYFDHRFGTYEGQTPAQANQGKLPEPDDRLHADPEFLAIPQYWLPADLVRARTSGLWSRSWLLVWRKIVRSTDSRTFIAGLLPTCGLANSAIAGYPQAEPAKVICLLGNLSSFVFDYVARQKLGGTNMAGFITKQLPALAPDVYDSSAPWDVARKLESWVIDRVLELTYTAWDLAGLAADLGWDGPPFRWEQERRLQLRAELDAAFFHLYGIGRDEVDYIMDTFPIIRRNDEKGHGEYLTKRRILESFDAMARAIETGESYETRLNPPPADPRTAHPAKEDQRAQ
jgi:hypothetical protein